MQCVDPSAHPHGVRAPRRLPSRCHCVRPTVRPLRPVATSRVTVGAPALRRRAVRQWGRSRRRFHLRHSHRKRGFLHQQALIATVVRLEHARLHANVRGHPAGRQVGDAACAKAGVQRGAVECAIARLVDHALAGLWWRRALFPHISSNVAASVENPSRHGPANLHGPITTALSSPAPQSMLAPAYRCLLWGWPVATQLAGPQAKSAWCAQCGGQSLGRSPDWPHESPMRWNHA